MTWYIGIGDDLKRDQKIRFNFVKEYAKDFTQKHLVIKTSLVECADQYDCNPILHLYSFEGR